MSHQNELLLKEVRPYASEEVVDVLISENTIKQISPKISKKSVRRVISGNNQILLPGLIDLHTHLREPGGEESETIATAAQAAILGGFTAIFAMPNTNPVADNVAVCAYVKKVAQAINLLDIYPIGAVTKNLAGMELAEIGLMATEMGVVIFSDDGNCIAEPQLMRRALEYASGMNLTIAQHAQEPTLTVNAVANESMLATELGLVGWPRVAEEMIIARDLMLADYYQANLHICHVSTQGAVELIKVAKQKNIRVTAEVTPHHLFFTETEIANYDPIFKVNPPLRELADVNSLREAVANGIIDCIATDHAPHASQLKQLDFNAAKPGMIGLQTALSIVIATLIQPGLITWRQLAKIMSENPAKIGKLTDQGQIIQEGSTANLILVDPDKNWTVNNKDIVSISKNNPYEGLTLPGKVNTTIYAGRVVQENGIIDV